jgi:hypothetical protein
MQDCIKSKGANDRVVPNEKDICMEGLYIKYRQKEKRMR